MRTLIAISGLTAALTLSLLAAPQANASCEGRKTTGTILGGVGGALLGNAVSHGGGGAVIGGLGGAVVGHQIGKDGCSRPTAYRAPVRSRRYVKTAKATYYYDSAGHRVYR